MRPRFCPWVTRPTHSRNGRIQVDKWIPVVAGYCPIEVDCGSCAGTGFKPNILLNVGRPSDTVPCPYCEPVSYKKEMQRLGKWQPPAEKPPEPPKKPVRRRRRPKPAGA